MDAKVLKGLLLSSPEGSAKAFVSIPQRSDCSVSTLIGEDFSAHFDFVILSFMLDPIFWHP